MIDALHVKSNPSYYNFYPPNRKSNRMWAMNTVLGSFSYFNDFSMLNLNRLNFQSEINKLTFFYLRMINECARYPFICYAITMEINLFHVKFGECSEKERIVTFISSWNWINHKYKWNCFGVFQTLSLEADFFLQKYSKSAKKSSIRSQHKEKNIHFIRNSFL